jgi:hypothetical protein
MADTQEQPQLSGENMPGSIREAQEALLGIMEPEEVKPKEEEAAPTEEEESTEEIQDESLEEEDQELEASEHDEEGSEDQTDDEEIEEPESDEPELYSVTVDGEEHEVTFDELLKGYSRQSDYTRKTQQLSNLRNEYEAAKQQYEQSIPQLDELKQQYSTALGQLINQSHAGLERFNIDWGRLKEEDSERYLMMRDEFRQAQDNIQKLQSKKKYEDSQIAEQQRQRLQQVVEQEHQSMTQLIPEWGDPKTRSEISQSIKEYGLSVGFTEQELSTIVDHRQLISLLKAMSFDSINEPELKAKKIKNKPKVVKPGKGKSKDREAKRSKANQMKRLQQSGHVRDATSLFEDFVDL